VVSLAAASAGVQPATFCTLSGTWGDGRSGVLLFGCGGIRLVRDGHGREDEDAGEG
jgi:hypothetical protein